MTDASVPEVASTPALPPPPPSFGPPPPPAFAAQEVASVALAVAPGFAPVYPPGHARAVVPESPAPLPPPTAETLAIPLGSRRLVGVSLDLLTRPDSGLRGASFYIGLLMLLMVGPAVALFAIAVTGGAFDAIAVDQGGFAPTPAWLPWLLLAAIPAALGFIAAGVEARALAVAVIGGRAEGRPLRPRESIAVARARFWRVLGAEVLVGLLTNGVGIVITLVLALLIGRPDVLSYGVSVVVGVVIGTPFIYAPAGIVLGEADIIEAMRRSVRLARARKQLAVVVTLFSVLAGLVVEFGLGLAADTVSRVLSGAGLVDSFPSGLVIPLVAALVFAYGTLVLLTEAIAAAPAVHAFVALTHYTGGLERGRRAPLPVARPWDPWFTPGLIAVTVVGLVALVGGILSM